MNINVAIVMEFFIQGSFESIYILLQMFFQFLITAVSDIVLVFGVSGIV